MPPDHIVSTSGSFTRPRECGVYGRVNSSHQCPQGGGGIFRAMRPGLARTTKADMTPDMVFECLLVSQDTDVLCAMDRLLERLSIRTSVCMTPSRALELLPERNADLIVLDWEDDRAAAELLRKIWSFEGRRKPTIVVISALNRPIAGVNVVLRKPFSVECAEKSLKNAYSSMVRDHRRYARYALMSPVVAKDQNNRSVGITITDVSQGGLGLCTKKSLLAIGDVLTFDLLLPGAERVIHIQVRVFWTRTHGVAGSELFRILPADFAILQHWLEGRCRIKKPQLNYDRQHHRQASDSGS